MGRTWPYKPEENGTFEKVPTPLLKSGSSGFVFNHAIKVG